MATFTGAASVASDQSFSERIIVGLALTAEKVLKEPSNTQFHSDRVVLAKKVTERNISVIDAAVHTLIGINPEAIDVNAPDKGLSDPSIEAACALHWNTLAGIDQGQ